MSNEFGRKGGSEERRKRGDRRLREVKPQEAKGSWGLSEGLRSKVRRSLVPTSPHLLNSPVPTPIELADIAAMADSTNASAGVGNEEVKKSAAPPATALGTAATAEAAPRAASPAAAASAATDSTTATEQETTAAAASETAAPVAPAAAGDSADSAERSRSGSSSRDEVILLFQKLRSSVEFLPFSNHRRQDD